jgi:hypothetical protein
MFTSRKDVIVTGFSASGACSFFPENGLTPSVPPDYRKTKYKVSHREAPIVIVNAVLGGRCA